MFTNKPLYRIFALVTVFVLVLSGTRSAVAAASNDNFADATQITSLPYNTNADNTGATYEMGEPNPSCGYGSTPTSVWYSYTSPSTISVTARAYYSYFPVVLAIYTGTLGNLVQISCGSWDAQLTFQAQEGVTYYFQVDSFYPWNQGTIPFSLEITPPPNAGVCFGPFDPTIFDTMQFNDCSSDPGGVGFQSFTWDFGDGTALTSTNCCVNHQYSTDGAYSVQHTVTTVDGRSDSISVAFNVRTKDVAISTFSIPQTARVNQTKTINVNIQNKRYSDYVQVTLYKGLPGGGEQQIGTLTIYVPAKAKQATTFKFSYTFTSDDATVGKVTFRAVANIVNGRDALPADNTSIATTLISK